MESGLRRPLSLLRGRTQRQMQLRTNRRARSHALRVAIAVVLAISVATIASDSTRAIAADPRAELEAVRKRVDTIADQYFNAQQQSREIATELEALSRKIDRANRSIRRTQQRAIATAINLYRSQPRGFQPPSTESTLDAARSALFAQQSVARDNASINEYVQAEAKLRTDNEQLIRRQAEARRNVAKLNAESQDLDAALADAQVKYAALLRAEAAQRAADAQAKTTTSVRPGSAPNPNSSTPTTRASRVPGTQPGTAPTTQPTPGTTVPSPPPPTGTNAHHNDPFLACVRQRESRGYYGAVNPGGYYGAYQFAIRTWNTTASHAGRPQLIGVRPDRASPWDQDELAWVLYQWQGKGPWGGSCS